MSKSRDPWRQESYHNIEASEPESPVGKKRRVAAGDGPDFSASVEDARQDAEISTKSESSESQQAEDKVEREIYSGCSSSGGEGYENSNATGPSESFDEVDDPMFWGPYLAERQWGTVREDFSEHDNSWDHITHEDAVSHAYVSGEDGLLGVCDRFALFSASTALWNGKDCMLKERLFGLTGFEGNHGEDVKELYYYLDNTPDHSYMRALYKYPQSAFPYTLIREENKKRSLTQPEFEILDTGIFDSGYWDVTVEYAKTDHLGLACRITAMNKSEREEEIHVIPQFLFRNVQRGGEPVPCMTGHLQPVMSACSDGSVQIHYQLGHWRLEFLSEDCQDGALLLFTDNVSNPCKNCVDPQPYTKDAFHKYIVQGKHELVNPGRVGTKCCGVHRMVAGASGHVTVYWRIEPAHAHMQFTIDDLRRLFTDKRTEAQKFYDSIFSSVCSSEERNMAVQAMAGLFWSKQYYIYDVKAWLKDYRKCRQNTGRKARNTAWGHIRNHDILLMPDKWEFPWFAGWDLCISVVLYARFDAGFAKQQMLTFLSDRYMKAQGQLPGCEFDFGDFNPPLQPWACLHVYKIDGGQDRDFLRRCYFRLLLNYGWWCSLEFEDTRLYGRGFLGLDNISIIDRSGDLPPGWNLVQSDCSAWVACYCLWMLQIALELSSSDPSYLELVPKFLGHFLDIAEAMNKNLADRGLWHEEDRFYYDAFHTPDGIVPVRLRSWTGLIPLFAVCSITIPAFCPLEDTFNNFLLEYPQHMSRIGEHDFFLTLVPMEHVRSILQCVFNDDEFLSPFGIRSLSKVHEGCEMLIGDQHYFARYTPGESEGGEFGGNSNWRGPVWVFMNYLLLESLDCYHQRGIRTGRDLEFCHPTVEPEYEAPLGAIINDLAQRLISMFLPDENGDRPCHGPGTKYSTDPSWRHLVLFYEFSHADTGRGCGASHQTGWTAAVIELLLRLQNTRLKLRHCQLKLPSLFQGISGPYY